MKKILILNHNQERFGTYWRCLQIGRRLAARNYQVAMICASQENFDLRLRRKKITSNFEMIILPRIKYHKYFSGQIIRMLITIVLVFFLSYDICFAFAVAQPQIGLPAYLAKKIRRKKLIVDWDDLWGNGFGLEHGRLINTFLYKLERSILKQADKITYVSQLIGHEIDKLHLKIEKIKIPNGANNQEFRVENKIKSRNKLKLDIDKTYLVSIGNTYTDSLGIMLRAFRKVIKKINNATLIMVGQGEITSKFKNLYDSLKNNIILTGYKPFKDIPKYLSCADCLILPMDDSNIEKARFPMRFGDYLCAGRPIVSNAVGEVKYYLDKYHAGLVSSPKNDNKLGENMIKILLNKKSYDNLSLNARRLADNDLSWDVVINKLISEVILKI